tara:strand:- start:1312 stop:2145 length:834 start_codon:yes stop_codon:yes gene_type:complete
MINHEKNWKNYIDENKLDQSQLIPKKILNKSVWKNGEIDPSIREKLMEIAQDFYDHLNDEVEEIPELEDVIFTGSLASYNYHDLSDIDLHLLLDFSKFKKNPELLEKYFTAKRVNWNRVHDIMIGGHEVEIYVQDSNEEHLADGIYSLLKDEWDKKPKREEVSIDFDAAKKKFRNISNEIEELQNLFDKGEHRKVYDHSIKLKEKIAKMRRSGLAEGGIFSSENIAFKMLRMSLDLEKLSNLKNSSYDKMMSTSRDSDTKINISETWKKFINKGDQK